MVIRPEVPTSTEATSLPLMEAADARPDDALLLGNVPDDDLVSDTANLAEAAKFKPSETFARLV